MIKFIIRRLIQSIPTFFGITVLSYAIIAAAPGDPVSTLSFGPRTTQAQRDALSRQLGVDDPLWQQYIRWLIGDDFREFPKLDRYAKPVVDEDGNQVMVSGTNKGILRGDFGKSFTAKRPALEVVLEKIPATAELGGLSLLVSVTLGIPIGIMAAVWQGSLFDNLTRVMAVLFNAVPIFWLGLILLLVFGSWLGWLPMGGRYPDNYFLTGEVTFSDRIERLILPVFVLSTGGVAAFSRYMRASLLDVINQDYIRTAKAKGLTYSEVWFSHGARNALIPVATILGPAIPNILGGAILTETIFSWPGMGRLAFLAVTQQDYPIIMATVVLASLGTIVGFLLSDVFYALVDPRIRLS
jgi:peptide/nickel transport system permease protein